MKFGPIKNRHRCFKDAFDSREIIESESDTITEVTNVRRVTKEDYKINPDQVTDAETLANNLAFGQTCRNQLSVQDQISQK